MAATSGSVTCTKYYVKETPQKGFRDRFIEAAAHHVFVELKPEDEESERFGFCVFERPFDLNIRHDNAYFNSYLNLGLRVDRWKIPAALFKAHFREAETEYKNRVGLEKLSRHQKEDLKVMLTRKLRKKTLPAMRVYDLSWDLDAGVVRLWNTADAVNEAFQELFEKAFAHPLLRDGAFVSCERRGLSELELDKMLQLEPAHFHLDTQNNGAP